MKIHHNDVHLWLTYPDQIIDQDLIAKYLCLLSEEEKNKLRRFKLAKPRDQYLISIALLRYVLSRYFPIIQPHSWEFKHNEFGKPSIANENLPFHVEFNLSHTTGLIVMAVAKRAVGVDVEAQARAIKITEVSERYFTAAEHQLLLNSPETEQRQLFFRLWTLKEAYVKARGKRLADLLTKTSFQIMDDSITVSFSPEINDNPKNWQFKIIQPDIAHIISVAVSQATEINVTTMKIIPGLGISDAE